MNERAAGAAMRSAGRVDAASISDDDILELSIADFLAFLGKRIIDPGGIEGLDRILEILQPRPGSHMLVIGAGKGRSACDIACKHDCQVTVIETCTSSVCETQTLVTQSDLGNRVQCELGDIGELRFADNTFDYVIGLAVFTFVPHQRALSEVRRVLKDDGVFAGQELCWRKLPSDPLRERTARIFGCKKLDFHSLLGWVGTLRKAHFTVTRAEEYPFRVLSPAGLLRGEAWANSLRIISRLVRRRASRVRMAEIWSHFARSRDYYSCVVFSGSKQANKQVSLKLQLQGNCLGNGA